MKKMSFKCIFNWLYAKTLDRAMTERRPREDRETISPVYRPVSVSYVSRISLVALLLLVLGGWNNDVFAAWSGSGSAVKKVGSTYYVVYDTDEYELSKGKTNDHALSGPGAGLTFEAKRNRAGTGDLLVTQNSGTSKLYEGNPGKRTGYSWGVELVDFQNYGSYGVDVNTTKITFKNDASISTNTQKQIKNVFVTMAQYLEDPSTLSLDCGTADINSDPTSNTVMVAWCNVPAMKYEITNNDEGLFSVSLNVNSEVGKYNTSTFTIKYKHTTAGTHSAKLKITDTYNGYSKEITLSGITNKKQPTITWSPNDETFNVDDVLSATSAPGTTVTLSSISNESYVRCDGNTATMLAATSGKITITAQVVENEIYAPKTFTKDITITNLEKQYINWDQEFTRLKTTDGTKTITLNAISSSGLPVTYELVGDKTGLTLTQSGSTWTLTYSPTECTNTTIVAKQGGNDIYAPASSVSKAVKVIDPTKVCGTQETPVNSTVTLKETSATYNIDIPNSMTIQVSRTKTSWAWYTNGFKVEIYSGRNGTGTILNGPYEYEAGDINTSKTISLSGLNIAAKSVKLISDASNGYNVNSVTYTKQKDCNLSASSLSFETYPNTKTSAETVNVSYANYPISIECSNPKFTFSPTEFGDCDEYGTKTISVQYTAGVDEGTDVGYLYIKDNTGTTLKTCTLNVSISKVSQSITSHTIAKAYKTTDRVELSAVANSNLTDFIYTASPEGVASFEGNVMTFSQSGTVAITVTQPGSNVYAATSTTVENVVVSKVTPDIATNPTVATIKYLDNLTNGEGCQLSGGLATVTLRGDANTAVDGSFAWTNPAQVKEAPGNHDYSVTFTPTDGGMYNSNTFTQSVTISRADGGIEMNNGEVKVKVAGINDDLDECKIDLDNLIKSKINDEIDASRAGAVTFEVTSANKSNATIDDGNNVFSATAVGTYTIKATQAQTDYYEKATDEFTVTVERLMPTIAFDNTDNPQIIYSKDVITKPAARYYNGHEIDRNVQYQSDVDNISGAIYVDGTTLTARDVAVEEGLAVPVTITASTTQDAIYEAAETTVDHLYSVRAKRSPHFTMDGHTDEAVSKTLHIGETATITYNENTDNLFAIGTAAELSYISYTHDPEHRTITVHAKKGTLVGDGVQTLTLSQPGTERLFPRSVVYTFTVERNVSALTLTGTGNMYVEDTIATPFSGLANTGDAVLFSCSPEGSMKYEDGKLIALQAGTNTVTFSQPATEYWTGVSQSKTITVNKHDAVVSTELNNRHAWYSIIEHPFVSENPNPMTITSSNEGLAKYIAEEDKIYVYGTSGNVTFTMTQEANYKYNAVNYSKTIEIFQPNNRLTMTLTEGNLSDYNGGSAGGVQWNGSGVVVGSPDRWGKVFDWDDKYIILSFVGIPDELTFDFERTVSIATEIDWYFGQSANGRDWETLKTDDSQILGGTASGSESFKLKPSTRYVKLCYSGNYGARFKNVKITERKEIVPQAATTDFGLGYNGNDPTSRTIKVDWYNVKECTVTIQDDAEGRFELADGSNVIHSLLDNYGMAELVVRYKHDVNTATQHTATLHIASADGKTADVTLKGQTTPAPQDIVWRNDLTPMPLNGVFESAVMVSSGQALSLVSDNPEIVRVENETTLVGVAAGTTRVTATAVGSEKWAETTSSIEIEVTTKKVQFITWNDKLSNLKREDGQTVNITLTATSSAGQPITYELDEEAAAFASVEGNTLHLTGWGSGTITAHQKGNEEYVAVQKSMTLVSRNPSAGCNPLVGEYKSNYTLHTIAEKVIDLNAEPGSIDFWAKCDASAINGMYIAEYYGGYWHEEGDATVYLARTGSGNIISSTDTHFGPYPLHRNTTAVKLFTKTGATMTRTFHDVKVTLAKYLELAANDMNFSQVDKGASKIQYFYLDYSNISGVLDVELETESTQFEIITETVGEDCGDAAKNLPVAVKFTGKTQGTENNKIIVSNKDQRLEIPVSATVVLPSQTITWNPEVNVWTTDHVVLSATATSGLEVSFTSGNTDIAEVVKDGDVYSLNIKKYGDVLITAHQTGSESWSAATDRTVTYHISRVTPDIQSQPIATGVILPNTLAASTLEGGEASVAGTFVWQDPSQNVTGGTANYTAQFVPENTNYYYTVSFPVEVPILKTPQTIEWSRAAESEEWCADVIALDATATSGLEVVYHSSDSTIAYAEGDHLKVLKYGVVTITAVQAGNETYAAAENVTKQITLKRNQLTLSNLSATFMYVHHFLSNSTPTGQAYAGESPIGGSFEWQEPEKLMDNPGMNTCVATFIPYNPDIYEPKTATFSVEVRRFAPAISHTFTTEPADYGVKISELVLSGSGKATDYTDPANPEIEGEFVWKNPNHIPFVRETNAILVFRPTRSEWYDEVEISIGITINSVGYIFTGDGDWGTDANWAEGEAPDDIEDVIIQGHVTITSDVEVHNMTIEGGGSVTMTLNGTLTVNGVSAEREEYGDVHVQETGSLILGNNAKLKVRDFILDAKLGDNRTNIAAASGQVSGETALEIYGNMYFDLALDPSGKCSQGWYDFTVPFPVDAVNGITRFRNSDHQEYSIRNEVNYAIMDFSESRRVETGYGWKKYHSVMQPGQCYTITIDSYDNIYRFKKTATGSLNLNYTTLMAYSDVENENKGWNCLGNGTLGHANLSVEGIEKVHIYSHATNSYTAVPLNEYTYVVGSAYMIQTPSAGKEITYTHEGGTRTLRAPRRSSSETEFMLSLSQEGANYSDDRLYVSADEEATYYYEAGRELTKFAAPTDSKVAQVWANAYGMKLCDVEAPLVDDEAAVVLSFYAPKAGSYTFAIDRMPEDEADLYLTYNGSDIWNLAESPYTLDLSKGTTEGYGLRIQSRNAPQITTGVDEINGEKEGNRKVLIGNDIYIITKEGAIFNATGKKVK